MSAPTVTVTQYVTSVDVAPNSTSVTVNTNSALGGIQGIVRVLGSSFSGSEGSSRTYVRSTSFNTSAAIVVLNYRPLDPSTDYSFSTTTNTNDTITFLVDLYNYDVVIIWT